MEPAWTWGLTDDLNETTNNLKGFTPPAMDAEHYTRLKEAAQALVAQLTSMGY
jgi:hypothetical protein